MDPERRFLPTEAPKVAGRTVSGVAARFNSRSENLGTEEHPVYEVILPGAFDGVLNDDVVAAFNHDETRILARSKGGKGSLKLLVDQFGLHYSFEAPNTATGNDLLESIKREDITASSFAFKVAPGGDTFTREADGSTLRTISKIARLYDVSCVVRPAYSATSVSARSKGGDSVTFPGVSGWAKIFKLLS